MINRYSKEDFEVNGFGSSLGAQIEATIRGLRSTARGIPQIEPSQSALQRNRNDGERYSRGDLEAEIEQFVALYREGRE